MLESGEECTGRRWEQKPGRKCSQYMLMTAIHGKDPACNSGDTRVQVQWLGWEDPLEEGMVTHSSVLAWRTPWTEESGGLQSAGSQTE